MDIDRFDLNLLKVLDALLREQHVSRAAQALHLSQPATSAALSRLREAFGDPLLMRTASGMQPTERALALAPRVRGVLQSAEQLLTGPEQFDPGSADLAFTIASSDYFIDLANTQLAQLLGSQAPGLRLAWRPITVDGLAGRMQRGEIDLAITSRERVPENLRSRTLMSETFVGIARKQHPQARKGLLLDTFCKLPHVLVSPGGSDVFHGRMDDALAQRGLSRRVAFSVPQFRFAVDIVESTDAIAAFPARLAAQYTQRVRCFDLPLVPPPFEVAMAWHERTHRSAPHQWLREMVLQCAV